MQRFWIALVALFCGLATALIPAAATDGVDPHAVFEERCGRCHEGHAGDFARKALVRLPNGSVGGARQKKPVGEILLHHHGALSAREIAALEEMFDRQLRSGGLYRRKCRICHDNAKHLARTQLTLRGDKLVGRFSGHDVSALLTYHGRLENDEAAIIEDMLAWQIRTQAD